MGALERLYTVASSGVNDMRRSPVLLSVLLSLVMAAPMLGFAAASPASAGTACDVKLSLIDGPQTDGPLTVHEWEDFIVWGYGFPANSTIDLSFDSASGAGAFEAATDSLGEFAEGFVFFRGTAPSTWTVTAEARPVELCLAIAQADLTVTQANPFTDVIGHSFDQEISWMYRAGITTGCAATLYCPEAPVTRQQMASFLARAFSLPATANDYFVDDAGSVHEQDINRLAEAGITQGCGPMLFCPTAQVSREQMASFLARAFSLPATANDYFTDDAGSVHEPDINRLAEAGLTTGCGNGTTYCPNAPITRSQMAAFLFRAIYLAGYTYP